MRTRTKESAAGVGRLDDHIQNRMIYVTLSWKGKGKSGSLDPGY